MINPDEDKRFSIVSAIEYLDNKRYKVEKFLSERFKRNDRDFILKELLANPVSLANIIKYNYEMAEDQRKKFVMNKICKEGTLTICLGAKGFGKTATAIWGAEIIKSLHPNKKVYWFGYSEALEKYYPWILQTYSLTGPEENAHMLFDETSLFMFSRDSMTREQKQKIKDLPTLRHRGLSVQFITQFAQSIDVDLFLLCDYIWFKPYFVTSFDKRLNLPKWLMHCLPFTKTENLVYDMNKECIYTFNNTLPSAWNDALSKPFSKIKTVEEAIALEKKLLKLGFTAREVSTILKVRGWDIGTD